MAGKYVFELGGGLTAVSTTVGGVSINIEGDDSFSTDDADVAAALRQVSGVKEVSKGDK